MNRKQWFALGFILFIFGVYLASMSTAWGSTCSGLMDSEEEIMYTACTIRAVSYSIPGHILFAFGFAFLACGYLERKK